MDFRPIILPIKRTRRVSCGTLDGEEMERRAGIFDSPARQVRHLLRRSFGDSLRVDVEACALEPLCKLRDNLPNMIVELNVHNTSGV